MKYYKFLTVENRGPYSAFDFTPYLPKRGKPGKWLPKVTELEMCHSGYHVCSEKDLLSWLQSKCYEVEGRGTILKGNDKVAFPQIRLVKLLRCDDVILRNFAADCAERVLPIFEEERPGDDRPRKAIQAGRDFADGKIGAAARAAAGAAAWAAALAAAWAAARDAAGDAAGDAALAAALAAARDAAGAAAWAAARDAAWAAARDAARAAARDAARAAAGAAAWAAARDAAWAEERSWQIRQLKKYLYGKIKVGKK